MQAVTTKQTAGALPFLRWVGGKRSLLDQILAHVPEEFDTYHEPFVGGGALFFELEAAGKFQRAVLNDTNKRLVTAYRALRDDVERVIKKLRRMPNDEAFFLKTRARKVDGFADPAAQAAWMIYLNRTCFNGLYRVNRKNEFNVPFGHLKDPPICDESNLRAVAQALRGSEIANEDFETALMLVHPGDFVYADPPFLKRVGSEFVSYAKGGFDREAHERLAECALDLKKRGARVLISNSDTDEVRGIYKDFDFEMVRGRRSVSRDGDGRAAAPDLLIW